MTAMSTTWSSNHISPSTYQNALSTLLQIQDLIKQHPYSISLHLFIARIYRDLEYPDLAAGEAYKALLLADALRDDSDEYHEVAWDDFPIFAEQRVDGDQVEVSVAAAAGGADEVWSDDEKLVPVDLVLEIYRVLCGSLISCCCFQSALQFCDQASAAFPKQNVLEKVRTDLNEAVAWYREHSSEASAIVLDDSSSWPDHGYVRRERYPWNNHEPDRLEDLETLNALLQEVAPKLEVRVVHLPLLAAAADGEQTESISRQLGVFAKEDISPGEIVLDETSLLTANNKLQDALCDACSADLPELDHPNATLITTCPDCEVIFCSQKCLDRAMEEYHPALCDQDVEGIAKDVPARDAADSLYSLLLLRAFAMAETQGLHPLDLHEIKYIWGDFHNLPVEPHWQSKNTSPSLPLTLPFSFNNNIRLPLHMLEKMDINIYTSPLAETWVFNTLYAKFRGTASARLSGRRLGSAVRGPEVSAVHFLWCLANHSCDPNVQWEWGGSIQFRVRESRVEWKNELRGEKKKGNLPGLRKGQEVLNHYCDIDLPVQERREWARGALGGDCRCERCLWEAGEV